MSLKLTRMAIVGALALVGAFAFPRSAQAVGEIAPAGCIDDNDSGPDTCALSANALADPTSVAVSPDGRSVYVTSLGDHALVRFNRSASGALTAAGCIDDNDVVADLCAQSVNGLEGAASVAVSPDGKSVYVASVTDNAIVRFNRSTTGALTPAGCIDDNDVVGDLCARSVNGLEAAAFVVVSPDGTSVYASSQDDEAIVRFNRSATGALSPAGCVDDNDTGDDACAQSVNGLGQPFAVAVSPDGKSAYAAGKEDAAIVRFNRSLTGALTPAGCINDSDTFGDLCAQSVNGLDGPFEGTMDVTVSPDGKSVYAVSGGDSAVVRFNRSSTGALLPAGCIDDNDTGPDTCAMSVNGLGFANGAVVSPDGKSVYAYSGQDDAVVRFDRSSVGALTFRGCVDDDDLIGPVNDDCAVSTNGLEFVSRGAVSPDGLSVYVVSRFDHSVVHLVRES